MKHYLLAAAALLSATSALAADVGVSISVGDPNFYGRLDIGNFPAPQLVLPQPVIVQHVPTPPQPIYLRVPPGHAKHWSKHCHEYNACGVPVYFVKDKWYNDVYAPRYREREGRRDDRRDGRRDRGEGHDRGRGHDKGDRGHGRD